MAPLRGETDKLQARSATTPAAVAIIAYPGAQAAAVHGLLDLLSVAGRLYGEGRDDSPGLTIAALESDHLPSAPPAYAALLLPPSLGPKPPSDPDGALVAWLRDRHRQGAALCSVCAGAFLLAETGLLDGRPATTHWGLRDAFAARFPAVALDTGRLLIDDGDLVSAGGLMAWVDLGLRLVDRILGPQTLAATARYFLVDPGGREQRSYQCFAPPTTHGDMAVLRVQRWLQGQVGARVALSAMARVAALSERTLLRRFRTATGLAPSAYLQRLRVEHAREHLERSALSFEEISARLGYEDPGAFRRLFRRITGLAPGEYRRRFRPAR